MRIIVTRQPVPRTTNALPRLLATTGALLACVLLTAGCASDDDYAYDLQSRELIGEWIADGDLATVVEIHEDGTFGAASWPVNATCLGTSAAYVDELAVAPTADFDGERRLWGGQVGSSLPHIRFGVPTDVCPDGTPQAYPWRDSEGVVSLCFPLSTSDPDSFQLYRMLILHRRGNPETPSGEPCV